MGERAAAITWPRGSGGLLLGLLALGVIIGAWAFRHSASRSGVIPSPTASMPGGPTAPVSIRLDLPECPHSWTPMKAHGDSVLASLVGDDGLALAGATTNVPEFHDCQRMVVEAPGQRADYGATAAVFMRADLGRTLEDSVSAWLAAPRRVAAPDADRSNRAGQGLFVAQVLADSLYDLLALPPGHSCIALRGHPAGGGLVQGGVFPVTSDDLCRTSAPDWTQVARTLTVEVVASRVAVPPVARWDWDPGRGNALGQQFIVIGCGARRWCELHGRADFAKAAAPPTWTPGTLPAEVKGAKGWYDEQELAIERLPAPPGARRVRPAGRRGAVFPDPALATRTDDAAYASQWARVAWIALDPRQSDYKKAWEHGAAANVLALCKGSARECGVPLSALPPKCRPEPDVAGWFGRVTGARGGVTYLCTQLRQFPPGVSPPSVPGIVRWRWRPDDETVWVRCPTGCCEVDVDLAGFQGEG